MCGNGQEHHKTPLFHQICTLIRKSPWYLTLFQTCRHRSHVVWKWSILGVFYYRSWLECVAVVRSITKRHFFIKIAHPRQCQIIYHTLLWGSGRAARHDDVILNSVDISWVHIQFRITLFRGSGRAARHNGTEWNHLCGSGIIKPYTLA